MGLWYQYYSEVVLTNSKNQKTDRKTWIRSRETWNASNWNISSLIQASKIWHNACWVQLLAWVLVNPWSCSHVLSNGWTVAGDADAVPTCNLDDESKCAACTTTVLCAFESYHNEISEWVCEEVVLMVVQVRNRNKQWWYQKLFQQRQTLNAVYVQHANKNEQTKHWFFQPTVINSTEC